MTKSNGKRTCYSRTARANARRLKKLRTMRGWSQETAAAETDRVVQEGAEEEQRAGDKNGPFTRRLEKRRRPGASVGLSKGAISSAERGARNYLFTFVILARLYGVTVEEITIEDDEDGMDAEEDESWQLSAAALPRTSGLNDSEFEDGDELPQLSWRLADTRR